MLDGGLDQAAGLRKGPRAPALNVMAIPATGDGSEAWVAHLAHLLRAMGSRPVVVDASRGAVVARSFGLNLRHELLDLLDGSAGFEAVAQATRDGVYVLRAERGIEAFVASGAPASELFTGFGRLSHGFDAVLLVMQPAELACLAAPANAVPVIALQGGDKGLVDSYGTMKQLSAGFGYNRFAVVTCGAGEAGEAEDAHTRLAMAARTFLNAEVSLAGALPVPGAMSHEPRASARMAGLARTLLHTAATRFPRTESFA